ncbi:hypothetical protein SAMN02745781_03516 [Vibrio gazogenes DSM 21264]|uniref:Uncharacterized protein n=1 Tax=Vibrio gazogenes DSM 21264 = NBRC 103151 TaxID=1123492 RepID=A0A1M5FL26_VIBGA|nr:hypothetical protein SAMN02745781_03516 [Vibrio gazogenes DSM 21264] [Vibrio gazogenes DSM 21264 = NBRC 103151]SJN57616.1 hypothetical protein BQ6471_02627 [Vibrio gazogenes]
MPYGWVSLGFALSVVTIPRNNEKLNFMYKKNLTTHQILFRNE